MDSIKVSCLFLLYMFFLCSLCGGANRERSVDHCYNLVAFPLDIRMIEYYSWLFCFLIEVVGFGASENWVGAI